MKVPGNFSRRQFLQSSAGLSLSWSGLRILAGSPHSSELSFPLKKQFIYGTAFYRPPNPPREKRREMLQTIAKEYGFNTIRIYPGWDYYNPAPDHFVFDDLEEVMHWCDEIGIKVLMGLVLETAPWWLEQAHPETRYVDAKGNIQRLQGSGNNMTGGWPGLCLDWQPVRNAAARYIQALAKFCTSHPSFYAYDCWNEPHIEPAWLRNIWAGPQERLFCYCAKTIEAFHVWLEKRYGSLQHLNEVWVRRYPSWQSIDPPRAMGTYMDWVDWRRFIIERSTAELKFRVEQLKAVDHSHVLEDHAGHNPPIDPITHSGIDGWQLAEVVDTWGVSIFPRWFNLPVSEGAAKFEITRCCAAGKEFWMAELQGGHGNRGLWRSPQMRPRDIRLWNWLAAACGANGILYWTYQAEGSGSESTGFGLVERSGASTDRAKEAARNRALFQSYWDVLEDHLPKPEIAILTDPDSALLTYAMNGQEEVSIKSFRGYYKALWSLDLWADFIKPESLKSATYKLIIAPWHIMAKEETCLELRRYVERGGTLILETAFGLFDSHCFYNPVIPPHGLAESFGYREKESFYIEPKTSESLVISNNASAVEKKFPIPTEDSVYAGAEIEVLEPVVLRIQAHTFLTPIEVSSAQAIARYRDFVVGARKKVGQGMVYYLGTNLGASIHSGDNAGIEFLRAIVIPVVKPDVTSFSLRPRFIKGKTRNLLAVFNDSTEDQSDQIKIPIPCRSVLDIHNQQEISMEEKGIRIEVPHQDVRVFLLQ